jgi:hypothetical protein
LAGGGTLAGPAALAQDLPRDPGPCLRAVLAQDARRDLLEGGDVVVRQGGELAAQPRGIDGQRSVGHQRGPPAAVLIRPSSS